MIIKEHENIHSKKKYVYMTAEVNFCMCCIFMLLIIVHGAELLHTGDIYFTVSV